jgi:F0F1-type ATP synthase membrane subunit b/b'
MDIFNISWQAIVSQILAFLILIWAMRKFLFGPISAVLEEKIQEALREAQALKDEIVGFAKAEAERTINRGREEIQREKTIALAELRTEVVDLAVTAAGKVLGRAIDDRAHRDLIRDFVDQVGAS